MADSFFQASPALWQQAFGAHPFVLCVGAIQPRKGQLLLAEACNRLKLPLTLLGPVLPGHSGYATQVDEAMHKNEEFGGKWLQHLDNTDPMLQSAYAACRVFALLSSSETQPLSVMEAMAARKPILLLQAAYTEDPLFSNLHQLSAPKIELAEEALRSAWNEARPTELSLTFSWLSVGKQLQTIYKTIASTPPRTGSRNG
ncbi:MAG: glycosyltransferase [Limisphaerales bacterium]